MSTGLSPSYGKYRPGEYLTRAHAYPANPSRLLSNGLPVCTDASPESEGDDPIVYTGFPTILGQLFLIYTGENSRPLNLSYPWNKGCVPL
jgi:hypothetical protein